MDVASGPQLFDARKWHETQPWDGGRRCRAVLAALVPRNIHLLSHADRERLTALGFNLPVATQGRSTERTEREVKGAWRPVPGTSLAVGLGYLRRPGGHPQARGQQRRPGAGEFAQAMRHMLEAFVSRHIPDPERSACALATGHLATPPYPREAVQELRRSWAKLLGGARTSWRSRRVSRSF